MAESTADATVHQLIKQARVLGLAQNPELPAAIRLCLASADQQRRGLHDEEILQICSLSGVDPRLPRTLQDRAELLVTEARRHLLMQQPQLTAPGGALHPEERAEACWRDCWHFLRVLIYSIASGRSAFTDSEGMAALRKLYALKGVPIHAMTIALEELHHLTRRETHNPDQQQQISACFHHLMRNLNESAVKS